MSVVEIKPDKENTRSVRRIIGRSLHQHLVEHGDTLAGFALVTWDHRGECVTAFSSGGSPVGRSLVPGYVSDALNRHIAIVVASERTAVSVDPGDGPG